MNENIIEQAVSESEYHTINALFDCLYKQSIYQEAVGDERLDYRGTDKDGNKENIGMSILKFIGRLINNIIYRIRSLFKKNNTKEQSQKIKEIDENLKAGSSEIDENLKAGSSEINPIKKFLNEHKGESSVKLGANTIAEIFEDRIVLCDHGGTEIEKKFIIQYVVEFNNPISKMICNINFENMGNQLKYLTGFMNTIEHSLENNDMQAFQHKSIGLLRGFDIKDIIIKNPQPVFPMDVITGRDRVYQQMKVMDPILRNLRTKIEKMDDIESIKSLKISLNMLWDNVIMPVQNISFAINGLLDSAYKLFGRSYSDDLKSSMDIINGERIDPKEIEHRIGSTRQAGKPLTGTMYLYGRTFCNDYRTDGLINPAGMRNMPELGRNFVNRIRQIQVGMIHRISDSADGNIIKQFVNIDRSSLGIAYAGYLKHFYEHNGIADNWSRDIKGRNINIFLLIIIERGDLAKDKIPEYPNEKKLGKIIFDTYTKIVGDIDHSTKDIDKNKGRNAGDETKNEVITIPIPEHPFGKMKGDEIIQDMIYMRR